MRGRPASALLAVTVTTVALAGCGVIAFSKDGESDANDACASIAATQGTDVSIADGLAGLTEAEELAGKAAAENDDYSELWSATKALNESLFIGSENLAQSAWANLVRICSDL